MVKLNKVDAYHTPYYIPSSGQVCMITFDFPPLSAFYLKASEGEGRTQMRKHRWVSPGNVLQVADRIKVETVMRLDEGAFTYPIYLRLSRKIERNSWVN